MCPTDLSDKSREEGRIKVDANINPMPVVSSDGTDTAVGSSAGSSSQAGEGGRRPAKVARTEERHNTGGGGRRPAGAHAPTSSQTMHCHLKRGWARVCVAP